MVIITLTDILRISIFVLFIAVFIIGFVISIILNTYKEKSKKWHDCTKCKNHYFRDTPDWYSCKKNLYDGSHHHNDVVWTKCKEFEEDKE